MSHRTRAAARLPILLLASAALLFCSVARAVPPPPGAENALTIMPFKTATYVPDSQSADLLNRLAEFSTELLVWSDSSTESVVAQFKAGNAVLIQHYHQWREPACEGVSDPHGLKAAVDYPVNTAKLPRGIIQFESIRLEYPL